MMLAARKPVFAKPSMNGLGGIFALAEENRAKGHYGKTHSRGEQTADTSDTTPGGTERTARNKRTEQGEENN